MLITKRVFALKEVAPKDILKGQKRTGFFRRRGENWVAVFKEDSREAVIVNKDNIPEGVDDSVLAEFYIMEQSKKTGIKVRFENLIEKK
jgi:hypothetical protein